MGMRTIARKNTVKISINFDQAVSGAKLIKRGSLYLIKNLNEGLKLLVRFWEVKGPKIWISKSENIYIESQRSEENFENKLPWIF